MKSLVVFAVLLIAVPSITAQLAEKLTREAVVVYERLARQIFEEYLAGSLTVCNDVTKLFQSNLANFSMLQKTLCVGENGLGNELYCDFVNDSLKLSADGLTKLQSLVESRDEIATNAFNLHFEKCKAIIREYVEETVESKFKNRSKFGCYFTQMRKNSKNFEQLFRDTIQENYERFTLRMREKFMTGIKKYTQTVIDGTKSCMALTKVSDCLKDFAKENADLKNKFRKNIEIIIEVFSGTFSSVLPNIDEVQEKFRQKKELIESYFQQCEL